MTKATFFKAPVFCKYLLSYFVVLLVPVGSLGYNGSQRLKQTVSHYVEKDQPGNA
ncbi:hypothetical protein LJK87_19975 [Paenibacillus sp. P25]|nr:hypothetical protein LJK87_19975 [Paenibacillus sp. P25]